MPIFATIMSIGSSILPAISGAGAGKGSPISGITGLLPGIMGGYQEAKAYGNAAKQVKKARKAQQKIGKEMTAYNQSLERSTQSLKIKPVYYFIPIGILAGLGIIVYGMSH